MTICIYVYYIPEKKIHPFIPYVPRHLLSIPFINRSSSLFVDEVSFCIKVSRLEDSLGLLEGFLVGVATTPQGIPHRFFVCRAGWRLFAVATVKKVFCSSLRNVHVPSSRSYTGRTF